jgi:hypothetical protein
MYDKIITNHNESKYFYVTVRKNIFIINTKNNQILHLTKKMIQTFYKKIYVIYFSIV